MDILNQSALLVGVTSFALGFSVLARNVRNKLFLAFAVLTTLVSLWALAFFLHKIWPDLGFYRLHLFFNVLLSPASLNLIRVMVRIQDRGSRRLLEFSALTSVFLSLAVLTHLDTVSWILQLIYFSPVLIVFQTLQLMWIDRKMRSGMKRFPKMPTVGLGRRTLIYVGALLVLATSVMDHVPWMGRVLPAIGNLGLIIYLFFLSQAITQQRLLNFGALISRSLVLIVVALTLTVVYSLLVAWIENSPGLFFLNSFIASFLLLMLLDPLRTFVGYFTQRLMSKRQQHLQSVLRDAQRRLTGVVDTGTLFQVILSTAEHTLSPKFAALFVLRSDGTKFRRVRATGQESVLPANHSTLHSSHSYLVSQATQANSANSASPAGLGKPGFREVLANQALLKYSEDLARHGKFPIVLDQILENEIDRSASRVQREFYMSLIEGLRALGANLMIPLFSSGKMLGFVVLDVPSPPEPWGNNWGLLPMIYPFFEQSAQMMQSMEIYARQREKERLAALGEMAAGLAHEIRNPLGAIKGAAQFLDPSQNRPESKFLKVIIDETDRLNRVVTQFLDYSKPPVLDLKAVDLSALTEKSLDLVRPGLNPGVELEFQRSRLPALVMAAPEQLQQVLLNLVQNANNALVGREDGSSPAAKGMIRVSVSVEGQAPHEEVFLVVEDTGCGIKKENLEKLFIPFFTTKPSGTGLGLSISQKIVESHRGRIEVASEEGLFTRFCVILPLAK